MNLCRLLVPSGCLHEISIVPDWRIWNRGDRGGEYCAPWAASKGVGRAVWLNAHMGIATGIVR